MLKYIFNTLLVLFLVSLNATAQNKSKETYIKGYVITSENKTIEGLLKTNDWEFSPQKVTFKTSTGEEKVYEMKDLTEFGISDSIKYVKTIVNMERSSDQYSINRNPEYVLETVFLKVLLEGEASLFEYKEPYLNRFFYSKADKEFEPLVYKKYVNSEGKNGENNTYQQQLSTQISCEAITNSNLERIKYNSKDLVDYFEKYHTCKNLDYKLYYDKTKKDVFNLYIQAGIVSISLPDNKKYNNTNWKVGVQGEFMLNKQRSVGFLVGTSLYPIQIPTPFFLEQIETLYALDNSIGCRWYVLNKNHKLFLNTTYSFISSFSKNITYINPFSVDPGPYEMYLEAQGFINLGVGYKYKEKLMFSLSRNLNSQRYNTYGPLIGTGEFGESNRILFTLAYQLF